MISEERKNKNYSLFIAKLQEIGVNTEQLEEFKDKLINSTYVGSNESGMAYDGAFLDVILRELTPSALKISEIFPEEIRPSRESIIKVCLLHQLAKINFFIPNNNAWEVENRKIFYKYAQTTDILKLGMKSFVMAQSHGVEFTIEEIEAMTIIDRGCDDEQSKFYASPLSVIIKQANELTYTKKRLMHGRN